MRVIMIIALVVLCAATLTAILQGCARPQPPGGGIYLGVH